MEQILLRSGTLLPLFHEQVYRFAQPNLDGFRVTMSKPVVAYDELVLES